MISPCGTSTSSDSERVLVLRHRELRPPKRPLCQHGAEPEDARADANLVGIDSVLDIFGKDTFHFQLQRLATNAPYGAARPRRNQTSSSSRGTTCTWRTQGCGLCPPRPQLQVHVENQLKGSYFVSYYCRSAIDLPMILT